jgi:hypothetical protein
MRLTCAILTLLLWLPGHGPQRASEIVPFAQLLAKPVSLKPELRDAHPRVFVTDAGLDTLRERARTTHAAEWKRVLAALPALKGDPPPAPGPQERRSQNNVAFAIVGVSLAFAVERRPEYLEAARKWTLAAIDYEPWGYSYNKPNVDLAAGHLLYAIGWAYDLLYHDLSEPERRRIRASLERHATLVYDYFAPAPGKRFNFTQNHDFIPTSGLAVTALALMGESADAGKWAALARAHHDRANQLLSPDGYYYEGMEYWIFSIPWLVHFYDAWEHSTGESLWERGPARNWKHYLAHSLLPDGQNMFDFGDIWEGALTRARSGAEYSRVYPGGMLQSNFNVMYRVAARMRDPESQAVAERYESFGHSNLEEYWTLLWRDPAVTATAMDTIPLRRHFEDMGVVYWRTSWSRDATAIAFKAGPPEGHRAARLTAAVPEWMLDSGHSHPDNGSFIIWTNGRYATGDTGYAGLPEARHHNTITVDGTGQGIEGQHDVWRRMPAAALDRIRITHVDADRGGLRLTADVAAAYPPSLGLTMFRRTFSASANRFTIQDEIATSSPRRLAWYLHSDIGIEHAGDAYVLGGALRARAGGTRVSADVQPTILTAPGQPGSITKGEHERRGYHLRLESSPVSSARLQIFLEPLKPSASQR